MCGVHAGAALFTELLVRQGMVSVGVAVATAGWGIAAVAAFLFVSLFLDTIAWSALIPRAERPRVVRSLLDALDRRIDQQSRAFCCRWWRVRARLATVACGSHNG